MNVVSVKHALLLVFRDAARVISPDTYEVHDLRSWAAQAVGADESCIRLVSGAMRVPEVIVLTRHAQPPGRYVPFTRRNLYRRDRYTCQYCGARPGSENLSIDHVVPRSRGGKTTWVNCVLACVRCNVRKGNRTPEEARMKLRRRPFQPKWMPELAVDRSVVRRSWAQFVSDRYWEVELEE